MMQKIWISRDKNNGYSNTLFFWREENKPNKIIYTFDMYYKEFTEERRMRFPGLKEKEKEAITFGPREEDQEYICSFKISVAKELFGLENIEEGSCNLYNLVATYEIIQ